MVLPINTSPFAMSMSSSWMKSHGVGRQLYRTYIFLRFFAIAMRETLFFLVLLRSRCEKQCFSLYFEALGLIGTHWVHWRPRVAGRWRGRPPGTYLQAKNSLWRKSLRSPKVFALFAFFQFSKFFNFWVKNRFKAFQCIFIILVIFSCSPTIGTFANVYIIFSDFKMGSNGIYMDFHWTLMRL